MIDLKEFESCSYSQFQHRGSLGPTNGSSGTERMDKVKI